MSSGLYFLNFHDLTYTNNTFTTYTADLMLAVVEQAFNAHWIVSLLMIYPDYTISRNLSTTLIEYYGLVESALK